MRDVGLSFVMGKLPCIIALTPNSDSNQMNCLQLPVTHTSSRSLLNCLPQNLSRAVLEATCLSGKRIIFERIPEEKNTLFLWVTHSCASFSNKRDPTWLPTWNGWETSSAGWLMVPKIETVSPKWKNCEQDKRSKGRGVRAGKVKLT